MQKLDISNPGFDRQIQELYNRPGYPPEIEKSVAEIIENVKKDGDSALVDYALKFDHVNLAPAQFRVTQNELDAAAGALNSAQKKAINAALKNVRVFTKARLPQNWTFSPRPGVKLGEQFTPMSRVGVYIPGGTAPLVSTVIHTAGIAKAAGVNTVVAVTPPDKNGNIHPAILYAMKKIGVDEIYRLGGVYGIAALACGTETIAPVEKIVGPGNAYVTAAKKLVYGKVAIDMVAGPSEILIIADRNANADFIAADMLSQAEHGSGLEQAVLISDSNSLLNAVAVAIDSQKKSLPRLATVEKVLSKGTFLIKVNDLFEGTAIASSYAPEHLELHCDKPERLLKHIKSAGAIFIGPWTPEPVGDFCAGPSHVLPTAGSSKFFSGLAVEAFFRRSSLVKYSQAAITKEIPFIEAFAEMESLTAHGRSGSIRR